APLPFGLGARARREREPAAELSPRVPVVRPAEAAEDTSAWDAVLPGGGQDFVPPFPFGGGSHGKSGATGVPQPAVAPAFALADVPADRGRSRKAAELAEPIAERPEVPLTCGDGGEPEPEPEPEPEQEEEQDAAGRSVADLLDLDGSAWGIGPRPSAGPLG
ncbi:MAG: hypothetical protein ACRDQB_06985, partial [Thermocrispum sp.]